MTTFDDREDLFEKQFAHDATLRFKAEARQAKLFGAWVAGKLGLEGAEAEQYAADVVAANLREPGTDDILEKVIPDLAAKGVSISETDLRSQLETELHNAMVQVAEEGQG